MSKVWVIAMLLGSLALVGSGCGPMESAPPAADERAGGGIGGTVGGGGTGAGGGGTGIGAVCGNGVVEPGEACDNGTNGGAYNGCTPECLLAPYCGDGVTQTDLGEVCDDGTNNGAYGGCQPGCAALAPYCGDNVVHSSFGESCDDGNINSGAGDTCVGCQEPATSKTSKISLPACASNVGCAAGKVCVAGQCLAPRNLGQSCDENADCAYAMPCGPANTCVHNGVRVTLRRITVVDAPALDDGGGFGLDNALELCGTLKVEGAVLWERKCGWLGGTTFPTTYGSPLHLKEGFSSPSSPNSFLASSVFHAASLPTEKLTLEARLVDLDSAWGADEVLYDGQILSFGTGWPTSKTLTVVNDPSATNGGKHEVDLVVEIEPYLFQ